MSFNLGTSDCTEAACPCTNASCSFSILIWVWIAPNHSLFHFLKVDLVDWFFWTNRKGADTLTLIFQAPATTGLLFSSLFQQLSKRKGFGPAPIARLDISNNGAWSDEGRGRFRIKAQGKRVVHSPFANPFSRRSRICWLPLLPLHHWKHGLVLPTSTNPWFIWSSTPLLMLARYCIEVSHDKPVWLRNCVCDVLHHSRLVWLWCTAVTDSVTCGKFGFQILESACPGAFVPAHRGLYALWDLVSEFLNQLVLRPLCPSSRALCPLLRL